MTEISIGPFVLPFSLLITFIAIAAGMAAGSRLASGDRQVERVLWLLVIIAVLAARAAFVVRYQDLYAVEPWRILDVRDGGFTARSGITAALVCGFYLAWRQPRSRKAILAGMLTCSVLWSAATFVLTAFSPARGLPAVTLTDIAGKEIALAGLVGKPVLVNLWASWCPPCRREMPVLAAAQRATPGVTFVFVNQGESVAAIRRYLASQSLKIDNVLLDPTGRTAAAARAPGLPTTLFIDAAGIVVDRRMGELSPATLGKGLERLIGPAARPAPAAVRAFPPA